MKIFDLHQDLMLHISSREKYGQNEQTSWTMLESSSVDLVIATAFPDPVSHDQSDPTTVSLITADIVKYRNFINQNKTTWQLVKNIADVTGTKKKLLLHIEGLNTVTGTKNDWDQLETWYELGIRSIGMFWNIDNSLGGGTNSPAQPLSLLGENVVQWIEAHTMLLDLAHAGRQTFFDIASLSKRPLYVSHGNVDGLCSSVRNYTDEQLKLIASTDGVIGVFFAKTFVTGKNIPGNIADVLDHIDYLKKLIGPRHIAIGSDFGGIISGGIDGLLSVSELPALVFGLEARGYTTNDIEAICYLNADRIVRAHLST